MNQRVWLIYPLLLRASEEVFLRVSSQKKQPTTTNLEKFKFWPTAWGPASLYIYLTLIWWKSSHSHLERLSGKLPTRQMIFSVPQLLLIFCVNGEVLCSKGRSLENVLYIPGHMEPSCSERVEYSRFKVREISGMGWIWLFPVPPTLPHCVCSSEGLPRPPQVSRTWWPSLDLLLWMSPGWSCACLVSCSSWLPCQTYLALGHLCFLLIRWALGKQCQKTNCVCKFCRKGQEGCPCVPQVVLVVWEILWII